MGVRGRPGLDPAPWDQRNFHRLFSVVSLPMYILFKEPCCFESVSSRVLQKYEAKMRPVRPRSSQSSWRVGRTVVSVGVRVRVGPSPPSDTEVVSYLYGLTVRTDSVLEEALASLSKLEGISRQEIIRVLSSSATSGPTMSFARTTRLNAWSHDGRRFGAAWL